MKQFESKTTSSLFMIQKNKHQIREIGQLRRAKHHASCLIEKTDNKNAFTPALLTLMEASLCLKTTNTHILSAYLKRSPVTIQVELQKIIAMFRKNSNNSILHHKQEVDAIQDDDVS